MKKTVIVLLVVLTLFSAMLAGCSSNNQAPSASQSAPASESASASEAASSAAPAGEGKTLTVMASQDWVKDAEIQLSEKFTEETGIKVDYQIIPADQYPNLLTTKLNSGECADIFMHQSGKFDIVSLLQIEKNAVDLSDQEWVSRFDEAVKDQVSANGKVYGITLWDQGDSYAYIYNKKIFADLGLNIPTTFEEFKQVCQTLLDNGITPIYECVADGWHHQLNFFDVAAAYDKSESGLIDNLNANKTTFAQTPAFATMLTQMKEIVDAGYWGEDYMSNEYANLPAALASGEYAMGVNMMGRVGLITEADPSQSVDNFGFFPAPYLDNQVIAETPCGPSKFIFSGSQNIDIAKQYLAFLAEPENLQYLIDTDSEFNSMPFSGLNSTYSPAIEEAMQKYKTGDATVYQNAVIYLNPQWMEIGSDITSYLLGDMSVDDVLKGIDTRRGDQAEAAGDPNWKS
jgi:raffinose/stachyose/melibiose transport system substrate-binding protein